MPRNHRRARRSLTALTASAAVAGAALVSLPAAQAATTTGTVTSVVKADAYVEKEAPTRTTGASTKVVAAATSSMTKKALLRFETPQLPAGAKVTKAEIRISSTRNQPARVDVASLGSARWDEKTVTWRTAPAAKGSVTSIAPAARSKGFSVDVTGPVQDAAPLNFAVSVPSGVSEILSKESGSATAPKLVVTYAVTTATPPPPAKPTPPPPPPVTPTPTPTPPPPVTPTPPPPPVTPTPPPPVTPAGTAFGANVEVLAGESYAQALARQNSRFGALEVARTFYPGLPGSWGGRLGNPGAPVVISFKARPQDVVAGKHDTFFASWFASAPKDRDIYWSYFHEPEDNVERGEFTASQWRDAFRRLDGLADRAGNGRLKATPILMCWTLQPGSGRKFADFYPGGDVVDVQGWDCYNRGVTKGQYYTPSFILDALVKQSAAVGKPWGLAEYGSKKVDGDRGEGRAEWLRASATYARSKGALFVNYFDSNIGAVENPDYRLLDEPSRLAWKWAVSGS